VIAAVLAKLIETGRHSVEFPRAVAGGGEHYRDRPAQQFF